MKPRDDFPYDRFFCNSPSDASGSSTSDDQSSRHPDPYLSDDSLAVGILACVCALAFLILAGWI